MGEKLKNEMENSPALQGKKTGEKKGPEMERKMVNSLENLIARHFCPLLFSIGLPFLPIADFLALLVTAETPLEPNLQPP